MTKPSDFYWLDDEGDESATAQISAEITNPSANDALYGTMRIHANWIDQTIRLVGCPRHFGGRQWYFVCPAQNRCVSVLWCFPGRTLFAGRKSLGKQVAYASQYYTPATRAQYMKDKLCDRIWEPGASDEWDVPPKPKWMRWRTYERALLLRDPTSAAGIGQFAAVRAVAPSLGVELTPVDVRDPGEIELNVAAFARSANGGMIVTSGGTGSPRKLIIGLASSHKLPSVYPYRYYAVDGGLATYGPNTLDPLRRAAGYVHRIFNGEKPADMPVQAPTKYELVINLKTANALGLTIPQSVLATSDEVIE